MGSKEASLIENYSIAVEGLYDSLKGFNSVADEARARCEKARRACEESRRACERRMTDSQQVTETSCRGRHDLEEEYVAALIAYHDALTATELPNEILPQQLLSQIDCRRSALHNVVRAFEQHQQGCGECGQKARPKGAAIARTGSHA